jgi:hypothetical protein
MLSSLEILIAGAFVVDISGGHADMPQRPSVFGPTGVQERGAGTRGLLGNLRDLSVSTDISGSGSGILTPRPTTQRRVAASEQDARVVSPSEGNEVRRNGRTGVGATHSTEGAIIPDPLFRRLRHGLLLRVRRTACDERAAQVL